MRSYRDKLEANPRTSGRPHDYADLLLEPITDDPLGSNQCYDGWEDDHMHAERFYVGGINWFIQNAGISVNKIADYRGDAVDKVVALTDSGEINWRNAKGCQGEPTRFWGPIARQQFNHVQKKKNRDTPEPFYFSKALVVIMACEIAAEELLKKAASGKHRFPNIIQPIINCAEDIYKVLAIIPACWNINNFNAARLEELKAQHPDFMDGLANACGRENGQFEFITDLAKGHTVQFDTAAAIFDYCTQKKIVIGPHAAIRATPGQYLGRLSASENEKVEAG